MTCKIYSERFRKEDLKSSLFKLVMHAILFDIHVMHEYFLKFWCEMGVRLPLLVHMEVGVSRLCKG